MLTHVGTVLGPCTKIESFVRESVKVGGHVGDTGPYSEVRNSIGYHGPAVMPIVLFGLPFGVRLTGAQLFL